MKLNQVTESELKLTQEFSDLKNKMEMSTMQDSLTGLPNRKIFEDRLLQVLNQSRRYKMIFAILFLNLDSFKMINDAFGLKAGDELLKQVAKRMLSAIRQTDTVSRFAGDEFVFILTQLNKNEMAAYVAQRLLDVIAEPFIIQNQKIFITCSIGVALYPSDGDTMDGLIKNADIALHQAKAHGRNVFQFYQKEMYDVSHRELVLMSGLRNAAVVQELLICYQPVINIEQKRISYMEAILFWEHPRFGLLSQNDFMKLAESSGNMIGIGDWLLSGSCKQFAKWKESGFDLDALVVKISLKQLENPHFTYKVSQLLHEYNLMPNALMLELTEVRLVQKSSLIEKSLQIFKQMGVQIGMNGFGTNKLSLQDLRLYPINYLKISLQLLQNITEDHESEAIIKMIISLGNTLGLRVIAEGVQSDRQKQLLYQLGCIIMQGALFSEPVKPEDFTDLLKNTIIELAHP